MIILFDFIPLQLVFIQYVYYFFRWMFCTTPMCHQVWYQKLCPPFMRMTKEPFFPRLFSTSQKKARAYWTWQIKSCNQWPRLRRWFKFSLHQLMNTYKWYYSFCFISICIITIYILYLTHFELFQFLYYLNLYTSTFFQPRYQLFLSCAWKQ